MTSSFLYLAAALLLSHAVKPLPSTNASSDDSCTFLIGNPTWRNAKNCLTSFPYNSTQAAVVADTVSKVAEMYVFGDIAKNTPDKTFQQDYDLYTALKQVFAKKDYSNDMEFQEAVSDAFIPLNDAHTGYSPNCYRQFIYSQPFYPVARVGKDGVTRLIIQGVGKGFPELEKYIGGEITQIEGTNAVPYLWDWAKEKNIGLNKDIMTRFNRATARAGFSNGEWKAYQGYFMVRAKLPETESVSYRILPASSGGKPEDVSIPWKVTLSGDLFRNGQSYWQQNCNFDVNGDESAGVESHNENKLVGSKRTTFLLNEARIAKELPAPILAFETVNEDLSATVKTSDKTKLTVVKEDEAIFGKALVTGPGIGFYTLQSNEQIGVLIVTTFSPPFGQTKAFRTAIAEIFKYIKENGINKLLIDLSGNGGGSSCLASELVAVFTPHLWKSFPVVPNQYLKDERLSPLIMKLHQAGMANNATQWDPKEWISGATGQNFKGAELFSPRMRPHSDGKDPYPYTQLLRDDCVTPEDNPLVNITHNLKPEDIAVFSNGMCGSACGRVHFHLAELNSVKSIVTGSFKGRKRSASGFPATQVLDYDVVAQDIIDLGLTGDKDAFRIIPYQADLRFAVRESYSRTKKNVPIEFLFLGSDISLDWDSWTALRPDRAWEQAAMELEWVPKWNKKVKAPEDE